MSPLHRTTEDPVRMLRWRGRRSWRRAARQIIAEHVDETLSRLAQFRGLPIYGVTTSGAGVLKTVLPGWAISITGVASSAQSALAAATEHPSHFSDAGRYGRFWWVAVDHDFPGGRGRTTVLGARLVVAAVEGGRPRFGAPDLSPLLRAS
jgi:hypothetical protein